MFRLNRPRHSQLDTISLKQRQVIPAFRLWAAKNRNMGGGFALDDDSDDAATLPPINQYLKLYEIELEKYGIDLVDLVSNSKGKLRFSSIQNVGINSYWIDGDYLYILADPDSNTWMIDAKTSFTLNRIVSDRFLYQTPSTVKSIEFDGLSIDYQQNEDLVLIDSDRVRSGDTITINLSLNISNAETIPSEERVAFFHVYEFALFIETVESVNWLGKKFIPFKSPIDSNFIWNQTRDLLYLVSRQELKVDLPLNKGYISRLGELDY